MTDTIPQSNIEVIGKALFGRSWMAQMARYISEISNRTITRQVVNRWHCDDKIPNWAHESLIKITKTRFNELQELHKNIDDKLSIFTAQTKKKAI